MAILPNTKVVEDWNPAEKADKENGWSIRFDRKKAAEKAVVPGEFCEGVYLADDGLRCKPGFVLGDWSPTGTDCPNLVINNSCPPNKEMAKDFVRFGSDVKSETAEATARYDDYYRKK